MLGPFLRRSVSYGRRSLSSGGSTSPICLTWGEGTEGQLGHYPFETSGVMKQYVELEPRQLEDLVLRDVACGTSHSLGVDGDGRVWSWGKSDYGKCGHGDDAECHEPRIVEALAGVDVASVACGESHSLCVDTEGRVYSWGWGGSWISGGGQLGHGDREHRAAAASSPSFVGPWVVLRVSSVVAPPAGPAADSRRPVRRLASVATAPVGMTPALVEGALASATVASVSAGEGHSVFLTDDGEVWTCGAGEHGRNGNGGSGDVLAPEPVAGRLKTG